MLLFRVILALIVSVFSMPSSAQWYSFEYQDKLDGSVSKEVRLGAIETVIAPHRQDQIRTKKAIMTIVCDSKKLHFLISVHNTLIAGSGFRVSYRIDNQQPIKNQRWSTSTDYTTFGLWDRNRAIKMVETLTKAKTIYIRSEDSVFGSMDAEFSLGGMTDALEGLRKTCHF